MGHLRSRCPPGQLDHGKNRRPQPRRLRIALAASLLQTVLAGCSHQLRVAHGPASRPASFGCIFFWILGASRAGHFEIRRHLVCPDLPRCLARRLFLPRLSAVHIVYWHRFLAGGGGNFALDGRNALSQSRRSPWTRPVAATEYCLVTCLVLRRTGDLWMPLGLHTAWNWGELFFYGVPSSGFVGHPHFLNSSFHGPDWLTGGTFGQDGTWPSLALLAIWGLGFSLRLRGAKYPNPAAIPDPRRRSRLLGQEKLG